MNLRVLTLLSFLIAMALEAAAYIAKPSDLTPTIKWEITDDGTLRIYGTGEMPDFGIWDKPKFWRQKKYFPNKIKRIEIGEGITKIGWLNFAYVKYEDRYTLRQIPISLPSTLRILNLSEVKLEDSRLPDGLKEIANMSDIGLPYGRLIIPSSVKTLGRYSIPGNVSEVIIESCPTLDPEMFYHRDNNNNKSTMRVIFKDPAIDLSPLFVVPKKEYSKTLFEGVKNITLVVPAGCKVDPKFDEFKDHYRIISPETKAAAEAEKNVNGYIANRLEPWPKYIAKQELPKLVTEDQAKTSIKSRIEYWQKKGEFESTEEWKKRVNEQTRAKMIKQLTADWNKAAKDAVEKYNSTVELYKKNYELKREALRKEFYTNLAKEAIIDYNTDEYTLNSPYDADNQTFLINTKRHGDILLKVPRSEAQGFKQNWNSIVGKIDFAFLPASDTSVGLSRIIFPYNGKEYSYDGKTRTAYKIKDVDYAYSPLEVTGLKIDNIGLTDIASAEPEGKVLTQSKPAASKKNTAVASDIDRDIPTVATKRDKTFAFIIANENYTRTDPVIFALNDGESVKKYCEKTLGIPASNISYTADASLNDMRYQLKRISDICNAFGSEASILVYYIGHGIPEEDSLDAYLLPVDGYAENVNTGLSLKEVVESLSGLQAENVTLILDACFSGTGREGKSLYASRGVARKPKKVDPKGNLVIFSASQGVESALPYKEKQHGLFTYFLLKKLKESRGNVSLGNLTEYVIDNVKRTSVVEGKMQTPTVNASFEKSDWRSISL